MENSFPTFEQLKQYIRGHPAATICEIRDNFDQRGDSVISITKPKCKKKQLILAFDINADFFAYLQSFMREDYVPTDDLSDEDVEAALLRILDAELKSLEPLQKLSKEIDEDIQDLVDLKRLDEDPETS